MPVRKRTGPPTVEPPRLPGSPEPVDGATVEDGAVIEGVLWSGEGPAGHRDLSVTASRLDGVRLTGRQLEGLTLVDTVVDGCELSGADLSGARLERVAFTGCRMSGLVASELTARHVRFSGCKLDGAWLRAAGLDHCELVDCDLTGADLYGARLTRSRLVGCRLDEAEMSGVHAEEVALHGSSLDGIRGAGALEGLVIGHDQVLALALPVLAARGVTVDDDYLEPVGGATAGAVDGTRPGPAR